MLLALVLLFFSCRTEILNDEATASTKKNKFQLTSKRISLDQSPHKLILLPEINKIETELKKSKQNIFGKTVNYRNGILIDTKNVIYIENGPNYHTYTFAIIHDDGSSNPLVQNLVLSPLPDGTYKKLIFTYNFTKAEKENILKGIPVDAKGKTVITELGDTSISSKSGGCEYEQETIWNDCSEGIHNKFNVGAWGECTADIPPSAHTIGYWSCEGGGGGGGDTENPGGGSGGGSGSGGCEADAFTDPTDPTTNPGLCGGGIVTDPNLATSFSLFIYFLPTSLKNVLYLPENADFYTGLKDFYESSSQSQQEKNFITWAILFKLNNQDVSWDQFQNWFLVDAPNNFAQQILLENPATILNYESLSSPNFKMRKVDQLKYPNFTALVKSLKTEIQNNPTTLSKLVELSGLSEQQVLASLTFGQGPNIRLVPNLTGPSGPNYGNFNPADPTYININLDFVLGLEQSSLSSTRHATAFLLAVTILHEFIHFGNYVTGYDTNGNEMGNLFEISTYGIIITHLNAGYYIIQLK